MTEVKDDPAAMLQSWNAEQKQRLLAVLAADLLQNGLKRPYAVKNAEQKPIAYLYPAFDPDHEFDGGFPLAYFFELQRRALTPDDSVPWSVMQSRLEKALDREKQE